MRGRHFCVEIMACSRTYVSWLGVDVVLFLGWRCLCGGLYATSAGCVCGGCGGA